MAKYKIDKVCLCTRSTCVDLRRMAPETWTNLVAGGECMHQHGHLHGEEEGKRIANTAMHHLSVLSVVVVAVVVQSR